MYRDVIRPAIDAADLAPIRADEEKVGGIIQKPMYERLLFCGYAVADLTTANANVFYELGVRHAVRPHSTVTLASKTTSNATVPTNCAAPPITERTFNPVIRDLPQRIPPT